MQISFVVEGQPRGKGRPRFTRTGHAYTDQATKAYERKVLQAWQEQSGVKMPDVPLEILLTAYFQMPQSWSKKKMLRMLGYPHTSRPDIDNIVKSVVDGISGHAFHDDNQVFRVVAEKRYDVEPPKVVVVIHPSRDSYTAQTIADMEVE